MNFDMLVPITFFIVSAFIIKTISDNNVRRKLAEKGELNENLKYLNLNSEMSLPSSLKWGIVLIAIGLAVIAGQLIPGDEEVVTVAAMFLLSGLGLLLYYTLAKKMLGEKE